MATTPRIDAIESPTTQTDILATKAGQKSYLHGTAYNSSIAPTVTGSVAFTNVYRGEFIPYQMQNGSWRMRFNITGSVASGSRTGQDILINGITSKNINASARQAVNSYSAASATMSVAWFENNSNQITIRHTSTTTTEYHVSGDVALESKPTWAY